MIAKGGGVRMKAPDTELRLMKTLTLIMAALSLAGPAAAAANSPEPIPGTWLVKGRWGPLTFTVNCRFTRLGGVIGGECVDGPTNDANIKGGKRHVIRAAALKGDQLSWTYQTRWTVYEFDARYSGVVRGRTMNGQLLALGKTGTFTAVRQ